jgi:4-hydroxybenzoate polyprenyltransferase
MDAIFHHALPSLLLISPKSLGHSNSWGAPVDYLFMFFHLSDMYYFGTVSIDLLDVRIDKLTQKIPYTPSETQNRIFPSP